jgi:hypothetical protein
MKGYKNTSIVLGQEREKCISYKDKYWHSSTLDELKDTSFSFKNLHVLS